jgi:hypothetical protein
MNKDGTSDAVIGALTSALEPARPRRLGREAAVLLALGLIQLTAYFWIAPPLDIEAARAALSPQTMLKVVMAGILVALLGYHALRSGTPNYKRSFVPVTAALAAAAGISLIFGWPAGSDIRAWLMPSMGMHCLLSTIALSLPAVVALLVAAKRAAPVKPARTALLIGGAAAAWGAFVHAFLCPVTSAPYVLAWYGGAALLITSSAGLILPRLLRW